MAIGEKSSLLARVGHPRHGFPALPSNEQATLALLQGEVDWAGNFRLRLIEFVDRDPDHHTYWFPTMGASVLLYPNHTRAPFDA